MRTKYSDFALISGVECPLVVYMRKDTPPGIQVPADLMKAKDFKVLSLNVQNTNSLNMALALDLLGIKYQHVPAYRGLKDVETAILQNIGQMANSSLSGWAASVEPTMGNVVLPVWQLSPRAENGSYPRSPALPNLQTFEEFYAQVRPGKAAQGTDGVRGFARLRRPAAGDVPRRDDAAEGIARGARYSAHRLRRRCGRIRSSSPTTPG